MLFPQLGPAYLNEPHRDVKARMEAFYAEAITINQTYWSEADTDNRFYVGDQTLWNDLYGNLPATRRRQFTFNRIMRVVNMQAGYQSRNRKSTICTPIENADNLTADQFTKILTWINQHEGVYETITEAFQGALISGMNLLHVWVDYRSDPVNGNIKVDNCAYNSFLIDPFFRKPDLSDCNGLWKRSYLTKRECVSLMPDREDEIVGLEGNMYSGMSHDGKFQFMPESYNYGMRNLLTYDEFHYRDFRQSKMLVDTQTGETQEWMGKGEGNEERLKEFLAQEPTIEVITQTVPTARMAIVIQGRVFYDGPNTLGIDSYPFIPVLAYYNPQTPYYPWRIQGVVRGLRDSQYLYNRRRAIELDILESQVNSGWIFKENALVNPKDVWDVLGQGRGIAIRKEAQMTDVQQIQAPQIPPSMIQLSELLAKEIQEISGVNDELLGSASENDVGILSMLRQSAGLVTLQRLYDQLDKSQMLLGKLMLDVIQANFTPGKVSKILEGEQPSPQFYSKAFGRYGCAVEEGLNTTTQKQMYMAQLLQLREAGVPIPDTAILDAATIQNKPKLMAMIEQQQQQQAQQQQAQMQLAMQEQQAKIQLAQARATADEGLGIERVSRVQENQALAIERRAAAIKDQDQGLLDIIKAIKELETIDINHMKELLGMAHAIKDAEAARSQVDLQPLPQFPQNNQTQGSPAVS